MPLITAGTITYGVSNISEVYKGEDLIWPLNGKYLQFDILTDGTIVWINDDNSSPVTARTISYSLDSGTTWANISSSSAITTANTINVYAGDTLLLKGNNSDYGQNSYSHFGGTAYFNVNGNILSLIYGDNFKAKTKVTSNNTFMHLFEGSNVVDASDLSLSIPRPTAECYEGMFYNCKNLVYPPSIPSIETSYWCCLAMFKGCTSLSNVPIIRTTSTAYGCYESMFEGCTSLVSATTLPATVLSERCYMNMFSGCTSLTSAPNLQATALRASCYKGMFSNCTSLTNVQQILPATKMYWDCYLGMFSGCTALTYTPILPSNELENGCYESMFEGCTSLVSATTLPATTLKAYCYENMFKDCTSLSTAPEIQATALTDAHYCCDAMFSGCTSLTNVQSALSATTLAVNCYYYMFAGCTSLQTAPILPAESFASMCYYAMFSGCSSLAYVKCLIANVPSDVKPYTRYWLSGVSGNGTFVKASTAEWPGRNGNSIPYGWTVTDA